MANKLIEAKGLKTFFPVTSGFFKTVSGYVKAVNNVDFSLYEGQIVSVVGESGCGKSTLGNSLLGLVLPTQGELALNGGNIDIAKKASWKKYRKDYQIIFQDPYSSLNPRLTVLEILKEPMLVHNICSKSQAKDKVAFLLEKVGLNPDYMNRYPHAFSGGQRQRIGIARVLGMDPKVIICDEIVSALDVSVQAQIIHLLLELKNEFNLSLVFIAHDLSLVKAISDYIYVMYLGKVVEENTGENLFKRPTHPYTRALIDSVPGLNPQVKPKILKGEINSSKNGSGCSFYPRCFNAKEKCKESEPELKQVHESKASCFFPLEE